MSFSTSGLIHGAILAYVAFGSAWQTPPAARVSLYDQAIRPNEKKIVWYHVAEKLPEIRPPRTKAAPQPLRATRKFTQEIVAGTRDDSKPPQLVWAPAPEVAPPKMQPLPNLVAVEQRPLTKIFTPPPQKPVTQVTPALPDAPLTASAVPDSKLPIEAARPKALVRAFQRPELKTASAALPALPDAPQVSPKVEGAAPAIPGAGLKPLLKPFTPPPGAVARQGNMAAVLPDAPQVTARLEGAAPAIPGSGLKPLVKQFTPPAAAPRKLGTAAATAPEPPSISGPPAQVAQLAIVGLDPAKLTAIPPAPPSHDASFSAGPKPQPKGASTDGAGADIALPGLTVRGGAHDSQPSVVPKLGPPSEKLLLAGVRAAIPAPGTAPPPPATPVAAAPDPALQGRMVYTIAIQMPNVTSFSGSWIVWFAERDAAPGAPPADMRGPSPLRKVDPKYVASAVADRIEGTVRLGAVIRKTGRIDAVTLLRHLDDRLDRTAMEALAKWEFEPARRNGAPVDVDAVFEIPFHLAPRPLK